MVFQGKEEKVRKMKWIISLILFNLFTISLFSDTTEKDLKNARKATYIFAINGKRGLLDQNGQVLVSPVFRNILFLNDGIIPAVDDQAFVLIKENGDIIDKKFWDIDYKFEEGLLAVQSFETKKWGYINFAGEYVIQASFDSLTCFSGGLAAVLINGKIGFIDHSGKTVIQPRYESLTNDRYQGAKRFSYNLSAVKLGGKWGYIDKKGSTAIDFTFDEANEFIGNVAKVKKESTEYLINQNGKVLYKSENIGLFWDSETNFIDIHDDADNTCLIFEKNTGKLHQKILNCGESESLKNGFIKFSVGNKYKKQNRGMMDNNGRIIVNPEFDFLYFDEDLNIMHVEKNAESGIIDKEGKYLLPLEYKEIIIVSENKFFVKKEKDAGFIIKPSTYIKLPEFNQITPARISKNNFVFIVEKNKKYGLLDMSGKSITSLKYDEIKEHYENNDESILFYVKKNDLWGFINESGAEYISLKYQDVCAFDKDRVFVKENGKTLLVDKKGTVIFEAPVDFDKTIKEYGDFNETPLNEKTEYEYLLSVEHDKSLCGLGLDRSTGLLAPDQWPGRWIIFKEKTPEKKK